MVSLKKDTYKQPKEKQEDEFGDLDRGIGIHEDKDWAGKLLDQPCPICTTLVGYICEVIKSVLVMCKVNYLE